MAKILIAIPCMDSVPAQFAHSLATLTKVGECVVAMQCGSLVYTSRENLAAEAIKQGADYVMWFDSDMMFAPNTLARLMDDIKEQGENVIMTGVYYRRVTPFSPVVYESLEIDDQNRATWVEVKHVPDDLFEVAGCGFGCLLAPTDVFVDVMAKYGTMFNPIGGTGEDLAFCWRARQCGWRFIADPRIPLGHVGHHIITSEYYQDYNELIKDKGNG